MEKTKEQRILLICESPTKAKHIREFLPNNYIVMASQGHITKLADKGDYNIGIDFKNDFKPLFEIDSNKREIVQKLKEQVKAADLVILASDDDREGEAISYHLKTQLKIPESKYKRVTYHEVTKAAVLKGIENPRKIDLDLVAAAISRQCADKCIGYRLSNIARNNVGAKSVGRCQSAGLLLITDREKEIQAFQSKTYYDLYLHFKKNATEFKAKYIGNGKDKFDSFDSLEAIQPIADICKKGQYTIKDITHKDSNENPKPPFITTTFQQEVAKRLGLSVKSAMDIAQQEFEAGFISYHRTDSTDLDPGFVDSAEKFIKDNYDKSLFVGQKEHKKAKGEQAGHEALRPTDITLTPELFKLKDSNDLHYKVYAIIWERTIQSLLRPCIYANVNYLIENTGHLFTFSTKEIKDPGFRTVSVIKTVDDDTEEIVAD